MSHHFFPSLTATWDETIASLNIVGPYRVCASSPASCLGRGSYGIVYPGNNASDPADSPSCFALKFVPLGGKKTNRIVYEKEVKIFRHLKVYITTKNVQWFPYVVRFYVDMILPIQHRSTHLTESCGVIVLELLSSRTLDQELRDLASRKIRLTVGRVYRYAYQLALAVRALHGAKVAHGDIKAENMIYDAKTDSVILFDFGLSSICTTNPPVVRNAACSPLYGAPEIVADAFAATHTGYNPFAADMYSVGHVLFHLISGNTMFSKWKSSSLETLCSVLGDMKKCEDEGEFNTFLTSYSRRAGTDKRFGYLLAHLLSSYPKSRMDAWEFTSYLEEVSKHQRNMELFAIDSMLMAKESVDDKKKHNNNGQFHTYGLVDY